ncbi:C4-dicarboxylate ABC transporter substrate-binding protein [Marinobacterium aestuarii]|uniref:C4-dicarboxylate ABC transporter substrate-binding protein n=1 Tax=Marinobacterium aestuarii TaxID=1821621 RepID=A0A1A9EWB5_9GAMM|nr:TRAP transporter substrate-binding protein [Marinobacterium aestuarii]ANG62206.1 C4-dicarboxylate ABC transporter substrate-binding protein [Marinobacterium aestuarii]
MRNFVFATAATISFMAGTAVAQETEVFDVSLPLGPTSHHAVGVLKFGEELERLSGGRLTIRPHYDNALGGEREVVEGISFGLIDMGISSTGPMGGFVDDFMLFDLPYVFTSPEQAYGFLDGQYGDGLAQKLDDQAGVKILGWMENGFRHNTNSVRALNTPDDLAGIRHRTQESRVQVDTWSALGANASPMAWTEVFTALQQGVMDSQENPIATIYDVKFYEVQKYLNLTGHVYSPAPLMMGSKLFNSLPDQDQAIVLEAAATAVQVQREASQLMEQQLITKLEELGMVVTRPDLALFRERVQPVIEQWKGTVGAELVNAAINFQP